MLILKHHDPRIFQENILENFPTKTMLKSQTGEIDDEDDDRQVERDRERARWQRIGTV